MTEVWKLGQDVKANEFYDKAQWLQYGVQGGVCNFKSELFAANRLTAVCNEMSKTYDQIIDDQNDYLVEIDASLDEISNLEDDLEAKIKKLEAEIEELTKKKEDGTITEEEEAELETKTGELNDLKSQADTTISGKQDELNGKVDKANNLDRKVKAEIATDYGNTAIEKGEPLSQTKDKRKSFWRKLSGSWNKQAERDAGKKLLEAGEGLLEQVNTSSKIDDEIAKKTKKSV